MSTFTVVEALGPRHLLGGAPVGLPGRAPPRHWRGTTPLVAKTTSTVTRLVVTVLDVVAVAVFVVIGRTVHTHGVGIAGIASTAWPFLVGLGVGEVVAAFWPAPATSIGAGVPVWIGAVAVGMALRVLAGQGTAFAFVLVALGFLGATMLGWRVVLGLVLRRRPDASGGQSTEAQAGPG